MTHERDIEHILDVWFADGPIEAPNRVLDAVADRIERQPQRPTWRLQWRTTTVKFWQRPTSAAAAILIVSLLAIVLAVGVLGAGQQTPSPSPAAVVASSQSPSTTDVSPSTSPADTPTRTALPNLPTTGCDGWITLAQCAGPLTPGRHSSARFAAPLSYEVPTGWENSTDEPQVFSLTKPATIYSNERILLWFDPQIVSQDPAAACMHIAGVTKDPTADDWLSFLTGAAFLTVTPPTPIELGGASGAWVDVRLTGSPGYECNKSGHGQHGTANIVTDQSSAPCAKSEPASDRGQCGMFWILTKDAPTRFIFLTLQDGTVVLGIVTDGGTGKPFETIVQEAMPIVTTFAFGSDSPSPEGSGAPSPSPSLASSGVGCDLEGVIGKPGIPVPCAGVLAPGAQVTANFSRPFGYVVPSGWTNPDDESGQFALATVDAKGSEIRVQVLPDPLIAIQVPSDPMVCTGHRAQSPERPTVAEWVSFLSSNFNTTPPIDVSIGGVPGKSIDVWSNSAWHCVPSDSRYDRRPVVTDGQTGGHHWDLRENVPQRFIFLSMPDGHTAVIGIRGSVRGDPFTSIVDQAMPVVESFSFPP